MATSSNKALLWIHPFRFARQNTEIVRIEFVDAIKKSAILGYRFAATEKSGSYQASPFQRSAGTSLIVSTPLRNKFHSCSGESAPGTWHAIPMIATGSLLKTRSVCARTCLASKASLMDEFVASGGFGVFIQRPSQVSRKAASACSSERPAT